MGRRLNLDGGDSKSRWRDANSRWGDASPRVPLTIQVLTGCVSKDKNKNFAQCVLPPYSPIRGFHTMPFKISFCMTWLIWLSHCIVFQIRKRNNEFTDYRICCLLLVFFFSTNHKTMLSSSLRQDIFEDLQGSRQYFNCKNFCMGGGFLQHWSNALVPEKGRRLNWGKTKQKQKKVFADNLSCFFPEIRWRPKKGLHCNLGLYSAGICRIYSCWLALLRLVIQRSNLDGGTPKSWWGDANSRWGGRIPRVPPTI